MRCVHCICVIQLEIAHTKMPDICVHVHVCQFSAHCLRPLAHMHTQYFYYSAMLAMIGTAMFIRMNWIIKAVLNLIALIVFIIVISVIRPCLFDNFDKTVYGICTSCTEFMEIKVEAGVLLVVLFLATVFLGRSVSVQAVLTK